MSKPPKHSPVDLVHGRDVVEYEHQGCVCHEGVATFPLDGLLLLNGVKHLENKLMEKGKYICLESSLITLPLEEFALVDCNNLGSLLH